MPRFDLGKYGYWCYRLADRNLYLTCYEQLRCGAQVVRNLCGLGLVGHFQALEISFRNLA